MTKPSKAELERIVGRLDRTVSFLRGAGHIEAAGDVSETIDRLCTLVEQEEPEQAKAAEEGHPELKHCPFCKSDDVGARTSSLRKGRPFTGRCCQCDAEGPPAATYDEAVVAWNMREGMVLTNFPQELLDALQPKVETLRKAAGRFWCRRHIVHADDTADLCAIVLRQLQEHLRWHYKDGARAMHPTEQEELCAELARMDGMLKGCEE